jgi:uridine kinase
MAKFEFVIKRNGAKVPFTPSRITNAIYRAAVAVGGRDKTIAEDLSEKVIAYLEQTLPSGHVPGVEEIQDAVEKMLIENGHARVAKAYILYRDERARLRQQRDAITFRPSENIPWSKIWQVLDWAVTHNLYSVENLNHRIANGEISDIISEAEMFYDEDIKIATEMIFQRKKDIRVVLITGPSSSGKTTTTIKLGQRLQQKELRLVTLNVDNYFFDLDDHPRDEFGDYDFEAPQALDLAMINDHLKKLIQGEEVRLPFYDFKTGKRTDNYLPMKIGAKDIILIDSLHGMYPAMTEEIPAEQKFKLYLEPLLQMKDLEGNYIRWTDIRLMRRMLRDAAFRAYDPEMTLTHWHYVRASEMRNIVPNVNQADHVISSAMPYELSIYQPKLIHFFQKWVEKYKKDALRQDAYERAARVLKLLKTITPIADDSVVPGDSVIREFIGGSTLKYH